MRRAGCLLAVAVLSSCGSPVEPYEADLALTTEAAERERQRRPVDESGGGECRRTQVRGASCRGPARVPEHAGGPGSPRSPNGAPEPSGQNPQIPVDGAFLANEPAGMTEVFGNNSAFPADLSGPNQARGAGASYDSWGWRSYGGNFSSVDPRMEGIPGSPSTSGPDDVWVGIFPEGHAPGTGPFSVAYSRPSDVPRRSMYWSMYLYFSDPFDYNTCTTKGFWMSQTGQNNHFLPIYRGGTAFGVYLQFNDGPPDTESNRIYDGMPSRDLDEQLGKWFHLEVLMVANTNGEENGRYRLWINGSLEVVHDDIYYFDEADFDRGRVGFETIRLNPTWGCLSGGNVPQRQFIALDDWYASYSSSRVH